MSINRRDFLRGVAGASGAAVAGSVLAGDGLVEQAEAASKLPSPSQSGIDHIVVVMMENRSFDHFLGWLPNANGRQAGLTYTDSNGGKRKTYRLTDYIGCEHPDPDHSYDGGRIECNNGRMNGWLRAGSNDEFAIGYYTEDELPFFSGLARNFTTLDRYFCSILGPTFPNRIFSWAAQTDRIDNAPELCTLPTILDSLAAAGVSHRYYYSNVPFLGLWGAKYIPVSALYAQFLLDASLGTLPAVSFLDPRYTLVDDGEGNDDHPHADLRAGEAFLGRVYTALTSGPKWSKTVLIVNRDEWGGFFDHVAPPRVIAPNSTDADLVNGKALLGCRVPVVIASPFTRGKTVNPRVNSLLYDHTSVLKLIEWRWGLSPLTSRDASAQVANLAYALNFGSPDFSVPLLPQIAVPRPTPCNNAGILDGVVGGQTDSYRLLHSDLMQGWPLP